MSSSDPFEKPDQFDWHHDEHIVVRRQPAIAIYDNPMGQVVIRQENEEPFEDDPYILIEPDRLAVVIAALQTYLAPPSGVAAPTNPPRTPGAERQARYRERQRNERNGGLTADAQGSMLDEG